MKKWRRLLSLALVVSFLMGCTGGGGSSSYSVSGIVVDAEKEGIPSVVLSFNEGEFGTATTDSVGKWRKDGLKGTVTIALVKDGWEFESGQVTKASTNVNFIGTKKTYVLSIEIEGEGTVNEEVLPSIASTDYEHGTRVQLTAVAAEGWHFSHWEDDLEGTDNPATVVVDEKKSVIAVFIKKAYTLNIETEGQGTVNEEILPLIASAGYEHGTRVQLTAVPAEGWRFSHWEGDLEGSDNPATVIVDEEKSVIAVFEQESYVLGIDVYGSGEVDIFPNKDSYEFGQVVHLVATPNEGWFLDQWWGDLDGIETSKDILMDSDRFVGADFKRVEDFWENLSANVTTTAVIAGRVHGWRATLTRTMPYDVKIISLLQIDQNGILVSETTDLAFYEDHNTLSVNLTYDVTPPLFEDWLDWVFIWMLEFQEYEFALWGR
jgi:hypothetical protein